MKVKTVNRGATIFLTDNELGLLRRMVGKIDIDELWKEMPSNERRAWSRRIRHGEFLRTDVNKRSGMYV